MFTVRQIKKTTQISHNSRNDKITVFIQWNAIQQTKYSLASHNVMNFTIFSKETKPKIIYTSPSHVYNFKSKQNEITENHT